MKRLFRRAALLALAVVGPTLHPAQLSAAGGDPQPVMMGRSAAALVAAKLAQDLKPKLSGVAVFAAPLRFDEPAPRAAELVAKLTGLVAGALGQGATHRPDPVPLATAQALGHGSKMIVYLDFEIARGELRGSADAYEVTKNVWDRARRPSVAPALHAFASARLDAEIRGYLAPVPLLASRIDKVMTEDRDVLAVACGDVDEDGALEVVTLSRRRVTIGRARQGRFVPARAAWLKDLSGIAPSPLREPLAGVAIVGGGSEGGARIDVGITDRMRGSRLDAELRPREAIAGIPFAVEGQDACATFEGTTAATKVDKCAPGDAPRRDDFSGSFDAVAIATVVAPDGSSRTVRAWHDPASAELHLATGESTAVIPRAGAQLALADLDGDGDPEVMFTLDVLSPPFATAETARPSDPDAVIISSWHPGQAPRERARVAVPTGVRALAACPPESAGAAPLVLATAGELWFLR
jgi:hypothetical protein